MRGRGGTAARLAAWVDRDVAAVAVVVVLGVLAFSPWWAGGRVFAPLDLLDGFYQPWAGPSPRASAHNHFTSDAVTNFLVYRRIAEESFAEDGWIGWSDRTYGGRPEHANTMATYGDWTVQLHRYLGFWTAWHLGLLGQFLVAGLGMLVLLRSRGATPLVGALGAVAYGANSQFVLWIYHRWQLGAFAWVPWLVWSIGRYRAGRGWAWPLVPAFMALAFLGGNLQTCGFVALVIGAAWLGWAVRWSPRLRVDGRLTAHLAAWTALGVGLAAFTLVPEAFAYAETLEVGLDRGGIGYRHGPVQPLLSALLIPVQA
ncbi:MAG: hypothetical protein GWN71_34495, partial [Gammaproteobacteria bacterium]|nr:hypothetical protein [Gammaproteobacteria bacterium]NIY11747.1 hypothetical protein [Gemmatimonadota bacterium]